MPKRNQTTRIARIPTTEPNRFIDVEVYYSLGGVNYFTYTNEPRGYWLSIQPVKVEGSWYSFEAFTGTKTLIEEANRFSAKRLQALAAQGDKLPKYEQLLAHVLAKNNLAKAA